MNSTSSDGLKDSSSSNNNGHFYEGSRSKRIKSDGSDVRLGEIDIEDYSEYRKRSFFQRRITRRLSRRSTTESKRGHLKIKYDGQKLYKTTHSFIYFVHEPHFAYNCAATDERETVPIIIFSNGELLPTLNLLQFTPEDGFRDLGTIPSLFSYTMGIP